MNYVEPCPNVRSRPEPPASVRQVSGGRYLHRVVRRSSPSPGLRCGTKPSCNEERCSRTRSRGSSAGGRFSGTTDDKSVPSAELVRETQAMHIPAGWVFGFFARNMGADDRSLSGATLSSRTTGSRVACHSPRCSEPTRRDGQGIPGLLAGGHPVGSSTPPASRPRGATRSSSR